MPRLRYGRELMTGHFTPAIHHFWGIVICALLVGLLVDACVLLPAWRRR